MKEWRIELAEKPGVPYGTGLVYRQNVQIPRAVQETRNVCLVPVETAPEPRAEPERQHIFKPGLSAVRERGEFGQVFLPLLGLDLAGLLAAAGVLVRAVYG